MRRTTSVPSGFLDRVVNESLKVPARVWQAALTGFVAADNREDLDRIQVPTLIIHGLKGRGLRLRRQ